MGLGYTESEIRFVAHKNFTDAELARLREQNFQNKLGRDPKDKAVLAFKKSKNIPKDQPVHPAVISFIELILNAPLNSSRHKMQEILHINGTGTDTNPTPQTLVKILNQVAAAEIKLEIEDKKNISKTTRTPTELRQMAIDAVMQNQSLITNDARREVGREMGLSSSAIVPMEAKQSQ